MDHQGFTSASAALAFITGGNAVFTIKSAKTGKHFTYKADCPKNKATGKKDPSDALRFVKVLTNGRNTDWSDQLFIGTLNTAAPSGVRPPAARATVTVEYPSYKALSWALGKLANSSDDRLPEGLEVFHEGSCCRCNRPLTDPSSIQAGIGPECATKGAM
jgi:hypothetical protein